MLVVRKHFITIAAALIWGASAISFPVLSAPRSLQRAEAKTLLENFDLIHQKIKTNFYDKRLHGVNWEEIGAKYRAKVQNDMPRREFTRIVNSMIEELHASHCELISEDDFGYYLLPSVLNRDLDGRMAAHIGVMGRYEGRDYLVTGALDGSPALKAGINAGDRIQSAEGSPFTTIGSFRGREGKPTALMVLKAGETQPRSIEVAPRKENILRAFLEATKKSAKVMLVEGRRMGYIHLWTMGHELFKQEMDNLILGKLYNTEGLILDLRDGFGGSPFGFSEVFFTPDIGWEQDFRGVTQQRPSGYGKPMVVLTNNGTRSAKEFLSYAFKKSGRATLVGTTTAGAFLGANGFAFEPGLLLELSVVGLKLDGRVLEGKGVSPDILVEPNATYTEQDSQLIRAKEALLKAITERTSKRLVENQR